MNSLLFFVILICLISCEIQEDNVLVLTDKNFDQAVKKHQYILVQFREIYSFITKKKFLDLLFYLS